MSSPHISPHSARRHRGKPHIQLLRVTYEPPPNKRRLARFGSTPPCHPVPTMGSECSPAVGQVATWNRMFARFFRGLEARSKQLTGVTGWGAGWTHPRRGGVTEPSPE
jgi:hypothetical protein